MLLVLFKSTTTVVVVYYSSTIIVVCTGWDKHVVKLYSPSSSCSVSIAVVASPCYLARAMLIASLKALCAPPFACCAEDYPALTQHLDWV